MTDAAWVAAAAGVVAASRATSGCPRPRCCSRATRAGIGGGLTLAVKGGHNGEHHNHNDVGSFVVASDGVPVIVDAGRPTYTAQTFGPDRYDIWTMQSGWHNVPVIGGARAAPGRRVRGRATSRSRSRCRGGARPRPRRRLPGGVLRSWRRTVRLDRRAARVAIDDRVGLDAGRGDGDDLRRRCGC